MGKKEIGSELRRLKQQSRPFYGKLMELCNQVEDLADIEKGERNWAVIVWIATGMLYLGRAIELLPIESEPIIFGAVLVSVAISLYAFERRRKRTKFKREAFERVREQLFGASLVSGRVSFDQIPRIASQLLDVDDVLQAEAEAVNDDREAEAVRHLGDLLTEAQGLPRKEKRKRRLGG